MPDYQLTRRTFLVAAASVATSCALYGPTRTLAMTEDPHPLSLYHTHTGECLEIDFHPRLCTPHNLNRINHFLRDFRTGEVHTIDTKLLVMLCSIQQAVGSRGTYEIISGYRSKVTNAKLRKSSSKVAKKSLHMSGRAIDIRLSDLKTITLRDLARSLKSGGVGYYADSDFIHIDTGRVRSW
jgi:uncharacterized protein YcbK (DUF882 family)